MTFLSIIIPFKKGKRYLKDCLKSIHEQDISDYEIILIVNNSDENIDDLTSNFDNIIIKRYDEELGVGKARNEALKIATGDYVYFIDSDDYIWEDGLKKLVDAAKQTNADFINGQRIETYYIKNRFNEEFSVNDPEIIKNNYSDEEFSMRLLLSKNDNMELLSVLHALIKKDKIKNIQFDETTQYYSDYSFMVDLINDIDSFFGVENAIYAKRISDDFINSPSLNQELEDNKGINDINAYMDIRDRIESELLKKLMINKIFDYYYTTFSHEFILEPNYKYLESFFDIADEFKSNIVNKTEINALKAGDTQKVVKLMKLRINFKRGINLIKEPWRFYHVLYYYYYNKRPIKNNRIIFESFSGNYYSDNPKYLYEYLYKNYKDDFELVWVLNDLHTKIPGNPKKVKRFSLKYHKLMATSKYWVINTRQAGRLVKRPEQVIISTWHGTPLKKLGFDMGNIYLNNPRTKERYILDSVDWDYFISPNSFSTPILKRAFAYEGKMLETGYPRNDLLYNYDENKIKEIKENLNLPSDKKIILYAPTWRDDEAYDVGKVKFKLKLELDKLENTISEEYIVLVRNHYLITDSDVTDYKDFAIDVSRYDDIAELYLISDVLITDYSSVFFDYANLKRPMLFYMYDIDRYEDELRGFYIDIRNEVPGPILKTTEEVIDALNNLDKIKVQYAEKYDDFYDKYCNLEDGNSSKRIVENVWPKNNAVKKKGLKSKLINFKECVFNSIIYNTYYNKDIDENLVYLESRDGLDFTGNIFRIVEELSTGNYGNLKIHVHAKPQVVDKIRAFQKNYNLKIDKIITKEAIATKTLEKAKYIFTDSGIRPKYVKREGQIFINTWHGTPLKLMGADNTAEEHRLGNVQHPLLSSDYLLYPNEFMMDKMLNAYMIEKIYPGKILLEGYPRNSVFFTQSKLKKDLNLNDYEIFVYMPTFRGILMNRDDESQKDDVEEYLTQIDSQLKNDQILFAKLHVLNESKIDFNKFKHIHPFPMGYETYDVLNMADVLITDYSSVFFDFANTQKKIILFNYDEKDYSSYRGFYFNLDELPFPKVQTVDELINELNTPKNYDDTEFLDKFCTYDRPDAVEHICRHIFLNQKECKETVVKNDNPNILIFAGALYKFGIASALFNLLNNVDRKKYNFFITFKQWEENIVKNHRGIFKLIPEDVEVLPLRFNLTPTVREKIDYNKFYLSSDDMECPESFDKLFKRSFVKQFGTIKWDRVIDYDGYNHDETLMFTKSGEKCDVWVHNDMIQENQCKGNQKLNILKEAYSEAENVCVVSSALIKPTSEISGCKDNIQVVHNLNDYESVIERSNKKLKLNKNTVVYNNDIHEVLKKSSLKFITIGRFSPEKGHKRLIKAFNRFCKDYPDAQLIIIGGYGVLYEETCRLVDSIEYGKNITLINNISNPMPIFKKCDLFILPSYYEGWPMVLMEADALNVPIISTDIESIRAMGDYAGKIVPNSEDGILQGMYDFVSGNVNCKNSDFKKYNENAVDEFRKIIEN